MVMVWSLRFVGVIRGPLAPFLGYMICARFLLARIEGELLPIAIASGG